MYRCLFIWFASLLYLAVFASPGFGEVIAVGENGFQVRIVRQVTPAPELVFDSIVHKIGSWWSSDHTWSGDASNLSIDLRRAAMIEALSDGGFCRHMEVVFHQPGSTLRMTGGLGPLQEMGINGALTIRTTKKDDKTEIECIYNVSGFSPGGFEQIAPLVDGVLALQLDRLVRFCGTGSADEVKPDVKPEAVELVDTVVELSCGECQFDLEGESCDLAIRHDGKAMFVDGFGIDDFGDAHDKEGLCNCIRKAKVTGKIVEGRFVAEKIDILKDQVK